MLRQGVCQPRVQRMTFYPLGTSLHAPQIRHFADIASVYKLTYLLTVLTVPA